MFKKILIITFTLMIAVSGFLTGFFSVGMVCVYAVDDDDLWQPLNSENELVDAFQYYCKSRDLTIEGSVADAVTTATTGTFNGLCNKLGIDITALQADIKKSTDSAGHIQYLFDSNGITAYNRIFSQFLQDNELEVGDTVDDKVLKSGDYYNPGSGGAFIYVANNSVTPTVFTQYRNKKTEQSLFTQVGSVYGFGTSYFAGLLSNSSGNYNLSFLVNGQSYNVPYSVYIYNDGVNSDSVRFNDISSSSLTTFIAVSKSATSGNILSECHSAIIYRNDKYYIGIVGKYLGSSYSNAVAYACCTEITNTISNNVISNVVVSITTNNQTINNNNYEGDTIINNEGDIINNNPDPEPSLPEPSDPNNTIHNVPENPLGPDGIDLPDIDIPNLPIGNLSQKFPFSIPWDLVAFYAMLDAEPQAPRFNGTMDLTLVQWNYDIDLAPFDSAAELCRKLQFGLFVVGLIVASRSIIRG